jgi:3-deoxy-7-phosphoheptulonate synthase
MNNFSNNILRNSESLGMIKTCVSLPWGPETWRHVEASQLPDYSASLEELKTIEQELFSLPPLVQKEEIDRLGSLFAEFGLSSTRHFFVQVGDCAETFLQPLDYATQTYAMIQRAFHLLQEKGVGPIMCARIAGQYAKGRSALHETIDGSIYPSFHGDIVNGLELIQRTPDPKRMIKGYDHCQQTLKALRTLSHGQDLSLGNNLFVGHEAYLLPYESGLARIDDQGVWYGSSGHFLWIGERTRDVKKAHIEFIRGLSNPIGVKIGPTVNSHDLEEIIQVLDRPYKEKRLFFIVRMGRHYIEEKMPPIIDALMHYPNVCWMVDPVHGNTKKLSSGLKTRYFDDVFQEVRSFLHILLSRDILPGGIHCEASAYPVTECLDGSRGIDESTINSFYTSACDPRLNQEQFMEIIDYCGQFLAQHYR